MNWLDIVIVLILLLSVWRGYETGLVAGLARLLGLFLGLAAALTYNQSLAAYLNELWNLDEKIMRIFPSLQVMPTPASPQGFSQVKAVAAWQEQWGLTGSWPGALQQGPVGDMARLIGESLSGLLARGLLEVLSFVIIFMVVSRLIYWGGSIMARLASFTFFGPLDRAGGIFLGLLRGTITVLILLALLVPLQLPALLMGGGTEGSWLARAMENSLVVPIFGHIIDTFNLTWPGLPAKLQGSMKTLLNQ